MEVDSLKIAEMIAEEHAGGHRKGVAEERARVRRELMADLDRLDIEAEQIVGAILGADSERWYSRKELIATFDRICPPGEE